MAVLFARHFLELAHCEPFYYRKVLDCLFYSAAQAAPGDRLRVALRGAGCLIMSRYSISLDKGVVFASTV